ncbi:DUF6559 family protein [Thalassotalea marina]|uniref:Uncharacterized protein n=1 Tax=Thalassotalea marina TaxID=1673741 RepID=A0A919BID9_9GAMM|nr:DUF6559 family protein [Thalassotalea marina]GHF91430.1 hypothetical protein GCM10017161_19090 [Thalassotalea marina]
MFEQYLKKRLIKKYARKLPQDLKANYGLHQYYSKEQVDAGIERMRLSSSTPKAINAVVYAYAMYCSETEFNEIHQFADVNSEYAELRAEIALILAIPSTFFEFDLLLTESGYSGGIIATNSLVKINAAKPDQL